MSLSFAVRKLHLKSLAALRPRTGQLTCQARAGQLTCHVRWLWQEPSAQLAELTEDNIKKSKKFTLSDTELNMGRLDAEDFMKLAEYFPNEDPWEMSIVKIDQKFKVNDVPSEKDKRLI